MRREDLKELGLESSVIDSVMKLHGQSINRIKDDYSDYDELKAQNDNLTSQVAKNDKDLKALRGQVKDNDELNTKIRSLESENKQAKEDFNNKISQMKLDHAVDKGLSDANARDAKPVKSLLDMDAIKLNDKGELEGLDDQLKGVKESHSYLFNEGSSSQYEPGGHNPKNDQTGSTDSMVKAFKGEK